MTSRSRLIILLLAIVGLGVSGEATWIHYNLLNGSAYAAPCDINETFNCSSVYMSAYGSVKGIPVALGGVLWFGLIAMIAGFTKPAATEEESKNSAAGAYVFALSTIALAVVLSLGYTSFAILKTYCVLCLATYACVIGIFIASGMASSAPMTSLPARLVGDLRSLVKQPLPLMVAVLFLLGTGTVMGYFRSEDGKPVAAPVSAAPKLEGAAAKQGAPQDLRSQLEAWVNGQPRVETGVPLNGAKVIVLKFSDFQCPGCKQTWIMYKPVLEKYAKEQPGLVRFVMKDFPLNSNCNVAVQTQMHPFSCEASVAYRAAVEKGKGEQMEQWIFDNQPTLTSPALRAAAKDIAGITDLDAEAAKRVPGIRKDTADGGALQINQTPTFYINGIKLPANQWLSPEAFDMVIDIELKRLAALAQKAGGQ